MNSTVIVNGLNCTGCAGTLSKRMLGVAGVTAVRVDLVPGGASRVDVEHDSMTATADVSKALTSMGYRVTPPSLAAAEGED